MVVGLRLLLDAQLDRGPLVVAREQALLIARVGQLRVRPQKDRSDHDAVYELSRGCGALKSTVS